MVSYLDKIIDAINIPKRVVDGAELFVRKLFGNAIKETGGLISDQIKYRRFKNQIIIFTKAKKLLEAKNIEPKQINFKLLVPLIEYSSLEEDENIQNIWANVISNINTYNSEPAFNLKCIEILKEITWPEIFFLDYFYLKNKKAEEEYNFNHPNSPIHPTMDVGFFRYLASDYKEHLKMTKDQIYMYIDRLISFGLIKYEDPILVAKPENITVAKNKTGKNKTIGINSYELSPSWKIQFTSFGLYFVRLCKYDLGNSR